MEVILTTITPLVASAASLRWSQQMQRPVPFKTFCQCWRHHQQQRCLHHQCLNQRGHNFKRCKVRSDTRPTVLPLSSVTSEVGYRHLHKHPLVLNCELNIQSLDPY